MDSNIPIVSAAETWKKLDLSILNKSLNQEVSYSDFFHALGYQDKDKVFFRTFDDKKRGGKGRNKDVELWNINSIISVLKTENAQDRGVFYVVNGGGQKIKNVQKARAQFIDFDDFSFEEQIEKLNQFQFEPSIIVKTQKSLHVYWILEDGDIKGFRELQERLNQYFGSDSSIKEESRVMRLYGFNHCKKDPVMVNLIKFSPELKYRQLDFHNVLPRLNQNASKSKPPVARPGGEKVPHGQRHNYVIRRVGYYVAKLGDDISDEIIFQTVWADFQENCVQEPAVTEEHFRENYMPTIQKWLRQRDTNKKDLYKMAGAYYRNRHPEKKFDESGIPWAEAMAEYAEHMESVSEADRIDSGYAQHKELKSAANEANKITEPLDYTDVGQANVFVSVYGDTVKYSRATGFLVYDGSVWNESEIKAQGLSQELTERQLEEANARVQDAQGMMAAVTAAGAVDMAKEAKALLYKERAFRKFVLSRRSSSKIKATLTESQPQIEINVDELDKDGFLLNTPDGTIDLRTGDMKPHVSTDYCTKLTTVSPGDENAEIFRSFLERVTVGDKDLERYLQEVAGMCAIGKVLRENLIIAYGEGGNGKSTLFNLLARVLGDYSGMLSAETLTASNQKNKSPEYAELRGKRLIIAAELEEGMRLDTAIVKKLCSTDPILAEKKFKDPFVFTPSHTIILYTNHLPKIGTSDKGTWDRIVAVPFLANFRGMKGEIKNYAEYLFEKCGGAVLTWIVEGAQRFISNEYNIAFPECVKRSIDQYRANNDWLQNFLDECCEIDDKYQAKSGELYERYRRYCDSTGEYKRAQRDFKQALMSAGFEDKKTMRGKVIFGLRIAPGGASGDVTTPWGRASPDVG